MPEPPAVVMRDNVIVRVWESENRRVTHIPIGQFPANGETTTLVIRMKHLPVLVAVHILVAGMHSYSVVCPTVPSVGAEAFVRPWATVHLRFTSSGPS